MEKKTEEKALNITDMLLCIPTRQKSSKLVEIKELSEKAGRKIYFELTELDYDECAYLKAKGDEMDACIVCMGIKEPKLNSEEFAKSQNEQMPQDALKKYLSAGTIEALSGEIQKLSGYRVITVEDVKKK